MSEPVRVPTAVDAVADSWVDALVELSPITGTFIGRPGGEDRLDDFSPEGDERAAEAARSALRRLEATETQDHIDLVTKADLGRDLRLRLELHEAQWHFRDLNVISSAVQEVREVFDLMPTETPDDWAVIARRFSAVPAALDGYTATLAEGIARGIVPARRQVVEVATQIGRLTGDSGVLASFAGDAETAAGSLPASLARDLADRTNAARVAYGDLGRFLREQLAPVAGEDDAVGRDWYALHSRRFLGAKIDLEETYRWGLEELHRMVAEQEEVAARILPGAGIAEVAAHLDRDPSTRLDGTDALRAWMQRTSDAAVADLGVRHFDIPEEIRRLECLIAPTHEGGIYYTGPSDDFTRPGRMWWSIPENETTFHTWRERTTVYHEGVPGHHLQIGQAVYNRATLNTWRRLVAGTSGHAEGWALYAERLMADLGHLDAPADRFGMLDAQRLRAARVVLDIGVHLRLPRPDGTGTWDAGYAWEFLRANVLMPDDVARFELDRYLGWPGQAPSYKIGERLWTALRDEVAAAEGPDFDLADFHRRALDLGGVGLDTLRAALTP